MSVPNTETFSLLDVTNEIGGGLTSLQACFDNANSSGFDPTYAESGYKLSEFRNYTSYTIQTTLTYTGTTLKLTTVSGGGATLVNWGDGNTDYYVSGISNAVTHDYTVSGTYYVIIKSQVSLTAINCYGNAGVIALDVSQNTSLRTFRFHSCSVVDLDFNSELLSYFICSSNKLTSATTDLILAKLDSSGVLNGKCQLYYQNPTVYPSEAGYVSKANLISKGWDIDTN